MKNDRTPPVSIQRCIYQLASSAVSISNPESNQPKETEMENVISTDGNDLVNRTLAMPTSIHTDDGRQLLLTSWEPLVTVGEVVTVKLEAHIVVPKSWKEGGGQ